MKEGVIIKNKKYLLAIFYNYFFNNSIYEFFYLSILSLLFVGSISLFKNFFDIKFLLYLLFISFILSITTKRLSSVLIYSKITKHLSMNLKKINEYKNYNYDNKDEKNIIAEDFKNNFIKGILYAGNKRYKKIKLSTHKWVVENVINDDKISNLYNIKIINKNKTSIILEVLLLATGKTNIKEAKRKGYKVILTLKK